MKERISIILAILVSCCACPAFATVYNVPGDSVTIQGGINLASYGDTVQVAANSYSENITLKNGVALIGADAATTTINGNIAGSAVTSSNCDPNTLLDSFTITNGLISNIDGGGMFISGGNPTITNCTFEENDIRHANGAGMYIFNGSPLVSNCTFIDNTVNLGTAGNNGGGMYIDNGSPLIINCTFWRNNAAGYGGGIYVDATPVLTNCIMWGNTATLGAPEIFYGGGIPIISYSDIEGSGGSAGWTGTVGIDGGGNIDADPLLESIFDVHLQAGSPCIDAGDNDAVPVGVTMNMDGTQRFLDDLSTADTGNGTAPIVDMGAYEYDPYIYVDASAPAAGDGTTWATAYKYLQDGLADVAISGLDILVAEGTYYPDEDEAGNVTLGARSETFQLINGVYIRGGYQTGGTHVREPSQYETILSGDLLENDGPDFANNDENSIHVVTGSTITDPNTILDGFTITAGNANGSGPDDDGGGMYNDSGSPTVISCTFRGNSAFTGGGMYNSNSSNPIVTNCRFTGNVTSGAGGGMYNSDSSPTVTNSIFTGNSADFSGGGMQNWDSSNPTVINCTFSDNSADNGGGMRNVNSSPMMTNCILWANTADNSNEIYNKGYGYIFDH